MTTINLRLKKKLWTYLIGIIFVNVLALLLLYHYIKSENSSTDSIVRFVKHEPSRELSSTKYEEKHARKTILLWNMPDKESYPKLLDSSRCNYCIITKDRSVHKFSDAVVFNYGGIRRPDDLPARSHSIPDQVYVWLCRESPKTTLHLHNYALKNFDNTFNWSMTYRSDSDVFYPYVEMLHRIHHHKRMEANLTYDPAGYVDFHYKDIDSLIKRKKFLASWVVGNCDVTPGARYRMNLVRKLMSAGLKVHRFGKCFKGSSFPQYRSEEAHDRLMEYKFYLAFENTGGCREYVTYKFWKNAIYSGAVPIVWGSSREDIARLAPKTSFIHVDDFKSTADLVKYLSYLNSNATAYREYFSWRETESSHDRSDKLKLSEDGWIFSTQEAFGFCKLCRMLHANKDGGSTEEHFRRKSITSLRHWWYGTESDACLSQS